jgi:hypothetical protein
VNAARQQDFDEEELRFEFALMELATALDALRELVNPEHVQNAIRAHRKVGEANARLLKLVTELLDEDAEEDTVPTEI